VTGVESRVRRLDLAHADTHDIVASGVFQFSGATYEVAFQTEAGLRECLNTMMALSGKPATPRLYLQARGYTSSEPEWPPSNLRFDYDVNHDVAAAVLVALDRHNEIHTWMTRGGAAPSHEDAILTHDSWNPAERRFPPQALITIDQLQELVVQWAFGEVLPPPVVDWAVEPHDEVGWL